MFIYFYTDLQYHRKRYICILYCRILNNMTEIVQTNDRNIITIPIKVREWLNIKPTDFVGFDKLNDGTITFHKIRCQRINNCKKRGEGGNGNTG